ncbi:outer membrane protein assembly complex, YaeT protein [Rhodomicrobium vannielii ATCC 17100]|uniref:Outer membrane protein assembly factor BamA n=1 Tax=Rhodomicrobium vannielii (strain ATCC 17100 / DSM 162 / LMG 4299 / NCIMB 10020 / ATH 3.1.1) TaxID=648757 RepID=E3HZP0_RHOVT|nr:outer membrane protein assembly factor BamA [Rhodomicrobium vannielii]ADP72150.1 outer membrane protein assembly complex, YaeT protein [Rhodomicrobium vannielii ATCC 17100]
MKIAAGLVAWLLILGVFVAVTSFARDARAASNGAMIRTVKVVGASRIEPETVQHYISLKPGDRYDPAKADDSIKALFQTGLFRDASLTMQGGALVVKVAENPLVARVAFEGAKDVTSDTLAKEVQLNAGGTFSKARAETDVQRILTAYRRQGYYTAQVEAKTIDREHDRIDVVFEITEGPQIKVVGINFIGNASFSDAELRGEITTTESGLLDFLRNSSVYDPDRLNLDREMLRRFYVKSGFADMRVLSATADVDSDKVDAEKKGFFVTFTLDEGARYTFGNLDVEATAHGLDAKALAASIKGKPGDIYNAELVDRSVEALTKAAAEAGAPFAQVRPRIDRDPVRRTISVAFVVEDGPRAYVERVEISGNTATKDEVIRREFRVAEGDAYNKVIVEQGRLRVMRTGFFKDVKVEKQPGSAPDRVDLALKVTEAETGNLGFALGYSSNDGIIGEVEYTERNLMGTGQYLQVKLSGSLSGNGAFNVSWTEPRFLDRNVSFGVDAFVKSADYTESAGYTVAGYKDFRVGGTTRFGFPITEEFSTGVNYTLMMDRVYGVDDDASLAVKQIKGTSVISSIGYNMIYDTRDNRKKPTRGFYFKGVQDLAGAGGDVNYIRSTSEARAYYPISQEIVLAGRAQAGNITGWGGQSVRVVDAFYKGSETIAGFKSFGPRDATTGYALGGTQFYSATAELRFPLPFVPSDLGLSGAVFASAGTMFGTDAASFAKAYAAANGTSNTLVTTNSSKLRASTGFSLIWDSPLGPLRADIATVLSKANGDKTQTFGFGYAGW